MARGKVAPPLARSGRRRLGHLRWGLVAHLKPWDAGRSRPHAAQPGPLAAELSGPPMRCIRDSIRVRVTSSIDSSQKKCIIDNIYIYIHFRRLFGSRSAVLSSTQARRANC